jgi:PAS domain S-box-containing protein
MLSDDQQETATLYALGALPAEHVPAFEKKLSKNSSLSKLTRELSDAAADFARVTAAGSKPSAGLRDRILAIPDAGAASPTLTDMFGLNEEAIVVTDSNGLIVWVNDTFTELCGYSMTELHGKRPGRLLRGPATDPEMSRHLGTVFATGKFCTGKIINYHKNGEPYWVSIAVNAILDENQLPLGFIAVQRKLEDPAATAA